ncbi:MAG: CHC2 zinc finger domain-containing protein [Thermomicrobiales bacterium]
MTTRPPDAPTSDHLAAFAALFLNRADTYLSLSLAGHWVCRKRSLTRGYLSAALAGEVALGLYSVDEHGLSRWACLDLDDASCGDRLALVVDQLIDPRQALLEASRRGFHVWLFVEHAPWESVQQWAVQLARRAGLEGTEIFPKGPGLNGVRAPLTPHPKDGQIYPLIDLTTGEIAADPWPLIAAVRPRPVADLPLDPDLPSAPPARSGSRTDHYELMAEVERHTRLRYYGPERAIGCCPFHDDRHPSFGVLGGFWRCFAGCGEGGLHAFRARMRERGGR